MARMTTTSDPASGLDRLEALITPDLWTRLDPVNRAAVVGWGTMLNVVHLVRGIRTLHAAGHCHAAIPVLRSVMEYTLGTMWLADAGEDAVDVMNRKFQGSQRKLLDELSDSGTGLAAFSPEAVQAFQDVLTAELDPHPDERLSAFKHLLQEYRFDKMVPVYNVLSGLTHLSLTGAEEFFQTKPDGIHVTQEPIHREVMPCEEVSLGMQFDTMLAYNELLTGKPWTADLAAIAKDHELSANLATRRPGRSAERHPTAEPSPDARQ